MRKKRILIGCLIIAGVVLAFTWKSIVFQGVLIHSSLKHPEVLAFTRLFCERIVASDSPTAEWLASVADSIGTDKTNYFYALKVHFTECHTSAANLRHGWVLVWEDSPTNALAGFWYQRNAPYLQMTISKVSPDDWKMRAVFPLNNCLFNPDVNDDGIVDSKDVETARKQ